MEKYINSAILRKDRYTFFPCPNGTLSIQSKVTQLPEIKHSFYLIGTHTVYVICYGLAPTQLIHVISAYWN